MKKRPAVRPPSTSSDPLPSFSKKTQLGASGAVVGAIIGGPIGALVGGIVGTAFGAAAEVSTGEDETSPVAPVNPPPNKPARVTRRRKSSRQRSTTKRVHASSVRTHRRRRAR